jgi:hypothetical protein
MPYNNEGFSDTDILQWKYSAVTMPHFYLPLEHDAPLWRSSYMTGSATLVPKNRFSSNGIRYLSMWKTRRPSFCAIMDRLLARPYFAERLWCKRFASSLSRMSKTAASLNAHFRCAFPILLCPPLDRFPADS